MPTFLRLKIVWSIVRPRCWLLRMPTDPNKCLTTYFDVLSALEKFLSALKRRLLISKFSVLIKFWQNFASGEFLRPWNRKNHQVVTFSFLKFVSSVVWRCRLLVRVPQDLNKYLAAYFDVLSAWKKFFWHPQASDGTFQKSMLASNFASEEPKTLQNH